MVFSYSPPVTKSVGSWYHPNSGINNDNISTKMEEIVFNILDLSKESGKLIHLDLSAFPISYRYAKLLAVTVRISVTSLVYLKLDTTALSNSEIKNIKKLLFDRNKTSSTIYDSSFPLSTKIHEMIVQFQKSKRTSSSLELKLGSPNQSISCFMIGKKNHAPDKNKLKTLRCIYWLLTKGNDRFFHALNKNSVSHYAFLCKDILQNDIKTQTTIEVLRNFLADYPGSLPFETNASRSLDRFALISERLGYFEKKPLLHLAAIVGNIEAIEYLIDTRKVDVDSLDDDNHKAIELAIIHGQLPSAMSLLRKTKLHNPFPLEKKNLHQDLLSLAIHQRDLESVRIIINQLGLEIPSLQLTKLNIFLLDSFSPIHIVLEAWHQASSDRSRDIRPYIDILEFLININDRLCLNRSDSTKGTPLWYALSTNNFQAARMILASDSKIEYPIEAGFTTSQHHMVSRAWHETDLQIEFINLMVKNARIPSIYPRLTPQDTANPELNARDLAGRVPLHIALSEPWEDKDTQQQIRVIQALLKNCSETINAQDESGKTPLHYLVSEPWRETPHQLQLIQLLLKKNPQLNIADKDKNTPVHIAAMRKCIGTITFFLDKRFMTNAELVVIHSAKRNYLDLTPLDCAIESKNIGTTELLLGKANSFLQSSYDRAIRLGLTDIAQLIRLRMQSLKTTDPQSHYSSDLHEPTALPPPSFAQQSELQILIKQLKEFLPSSPSTSSSSSDTSPFYVTLVAEMITDLENYLKVELEFSIINEEQALVHKSDPDHTTTSSSSSSAPSISVPVQNIDLKQFLQERKRFLEKLEKKHRQYKEMCDQILQDITDIFEITQTTGKSVPQMIELSSLLSYLKPILEEQGLEHKRLRNQYSAELSSIKTRSETNLSHLINQDLDSESLQKISDALTLGVNVNSPNCQELLKQAVIQGSNETVKLLSRYNINMNLKFKNDENLFKLAVDNNRSWIVLFMIANNPQIIANNPSFLSTPITDTAKYELEQLRKDMNSLQESYSDLRNMVFLNNAQIIDLRKDVDKLKDIADVSVRNRINEFIDHDEFGAYYRAFFEIFSAKMGNELLGLRASLSNWVPRTQSTLSEGLSYIPKLASLSPFPGASLAASLLMKIADSIVTDLEEKLLQIPSTILKSNEDCDHFVRLLALYSLEIFEEQLTYFDRFDKKSGYKVGKRAIDALVKSLITRFFLFMFTEFFLDDKHLFQSENKLDPMQQRAKSVVLSLIWFRPNKFVAFNNFKTFPGINHTIISLHTDKKLTLYQKLKQDRYAIGRTLGGIKSFKADFEGFKGKKKQLTDQGLMRRALLNSKDGLLHGKTSSSRPKDYPFLCVPNEEVVFINRQIPIMDGILRKNRIYEAHPADDLSLQNKTISYREVHKRLKAQFNQLREPLVEKPKKLTRSPGLYNTPAPFASAKGENPFDQIVPFIQNYLNPIRDEISRLQENESITQEYHSSCLARKIARLEELPPGQIRDNKLLEISIRIHDLERLKLTPNAIDSLRQSFKAVERLLNTQQQAPTSSSSSSQPSSRSSRPKRIKD